MPRLKALNRYWRAHPPVHLLVAAYLGYEAPEEDSARSPASADEPIVPTGVAWMSGMGSIPATDEVRNASTPEQALAAFERMFFGTLTEI